MREWLKKICGLKMGENKARIFFFACLTLGIFLAPIFSRFTHASPSQPIVNLSDAHRLRVEVIDSNIYTAMSQVWWMDNDRLILNGAYPADEQDASKRDWGILIWDTRDSSVRAYQSNKGLKVREGWVLECYYHMNRWINYSRNIYSTPKKWKSFLRSGQLGTEKEYEYEWHPYADKARKDRLIQHIPNPNSHIYSCDPKPFGYDGSEMLSGRETIPLLDKHGFIDIGPKHAIPIEARKVPHLYYRPGLKGALVLKGRMVRPFQVRMIVDPSPGGYYDFANLYQGGVGEIVHFNPDTAEITRYQLPGVFLHEPIIRAVTGGAYPHRACSFGATYTKDRKFIVQCSGNKENGFYYWDPKDNRIERLLAGHDTLYKGMISPDGCKFAFVSWKPSIFKDHIKSDVGKTLKVIDVCHGVTP